MSHLSICIFVFLCMSVKIMSIEMKTYDTKILATDEAVVLEDVRITNEDLTCLAPEEWLFDNIIYFNLLYQRNFLFKDAKNEIEVISPSLAQIIKLTRGRNLGILKQMLPGDILSKSIVLVPVNDATESKEGKHWSLLIFIPEEKIFLHMDTLLNVNERDGIAIANNILDILMEEKTNYSFYNCFDTKNVIQPNGYDCGLYLLQCARESLKHAFIHSGVFGNFVPKLLKIKSIEARQVILKRVKGLAQDNLKSEYL